MHTTTTRTGPMRPHSLVALALGASLLLGACGAGGSDDASDTEEKKETTTTTEAEEVTTTTEADEDEADEGDEPTDGLPTSEDAAPSGDWIQVRFNVAIEPPTEDFNPGSAEARLYDVTPDCDDDACDLSFAPGGEDDSYAMPDTEVITGEDVELTAEGDEWVGEYSYPDAVGCSNELEGPYIETEETRTLEPVYDDDGELTGLVGTMILVDTVNAEGEAAGCPEEANAVYAYAVVMAPFDGIENTEEYEVDGSFRQTLEVYESDGYLSELMQDGAISTTLPDYDIDLSGGCADGECEVEYSALNADGNVREMTMSTTDGLSLSGTLDEVGGCYDAMTQEVVLEGGAYDTTVEYSKLVPIWIEEGEVKAFVGRYRTESMPTDLGMLESACSDPLSAEGWVYLVDSDTFEDL